jgi:hypothetical protein
LRREAIDRVVDVAQRSLQSQAHHGLVFDRVQRVETDEQVIDAEVEEGVHALVGHPVAVGVEAQLGLRQTFADVLQTRE